MRTNALPGVLNSERTGRSRLHLHHRQLELQRLRPSVFETGQPRLLHLRGHGALAGKAAGAVAGLGRAALLAYFLAPSVLVSLLFWCPLRCFSQAMAPLPASTAAAIRAIERKCFTGLVSFEFDRSSLAAFNLSVLLCPHRSMAGKTRAVMGRGHCHSDQPGREGHALLLDFRGAAPGA
jgi:hypothetical protein